MKVQISILGVGLIGGSLALSLKQNQHVMVTGFDINEGNLIQAKRRGIVDFITTDLTEATANADFIFLCTHVEAIYELMEQLQRLPMKEDVIISDTGSTKKSIMEYAKSLNQQGAYFIGGHPMAGSHQSGAEAADGSLFTDAYYILTPFVETPLEKLDQLQQLLSNTGAKLILMEPEEHDIVTGAISHFPHIVASALVNQVACYDQDNPWYKKLAAGGFHDITRIASSNPQMWRDILLHNRDTLLSLVEDWKQSMEHIGHLLTEMDAEGIEQFFHQANQYRSNLTNDNPNF